MLRILLGCAVVVFVAGCASGVTTSEQDWRERMLQNARAPDVMAQFCALETTQPGYLRVSDVKRKDGRAVSMGSTLIAFLGTTPSGQSIFESYGGKLDEFAAFIVSPTNTARHVFQANNKLYTVGEWSAWVRPDFVSSDREIGFKLLYGKNVVGEVRGSITVLARYKIGSYVDWRKETDGISKDNRRSDLEPCPLAPDTTLQGTPRLPAARP